MSTETKKQIALEIAHVLFIDIVGYSKLSINDQNAAVEELNQVVRVSDQLQRAEAASRLLKIATGDGMALVFYASPEAPAQCAVEISRALKEHPRLHVRMGIHSGPVSGVVDVNGRPNLAGAGLNMAQRVMACGDAGHILVSKHVAEDLEEYEHWRPLLHDLGTCEVKHGMRVAIANLYADEVGNPQLPKKFQALKKRRARMRWAAITATLLALAAIIAGIAMFSRYRVQPAPAAPEKSIAVLPFENRSRDPDNAYFADGIQDEILTRLSKIADLKVISRTSTQHYKSAPENLPEIARQLGVAHILEGSVQKSADSVRVNVQLIKAANDSHLWAETFDRKLTDVFGVESEIAKRIAESLLAKLTKREEQALAVIPTNNPEAYDAYLRGLAFEARSDFDALGKAISSYEQAVDLDPNFALGWARLSRGHALFYVREAGDITAARRDAAKSALDRAQKLQPDSPETLLASGYYQYWVLRDYQLAKTTFKRVQEMLPGSSDALMGLGAVSRRDGHWDQSVAYWEQALVLDPRNMELLVKAASTYAELRQFPAALKLYDRALDIVPNEPNLMASKAGIYQAEGNLEQAGKFLSQINAQTPSPIALGIKMTQLRVERNYAELIRLLQARQALPPSASETIKAITQVELALHQRVANDIAGAKVTAEQARNTLGQLCKNQPDNPDFAVLLSLAYAALGEKNSALKEAERATMLLPSAKDRVYGPSFEEDLAAIQTMFGVNSEAISTLARLLQMPYFGGFYFETPVTPALLRLDPLWDPLRGDPAFQKLVAAEAPKSGQK
jgi:TolB-like protein/Tfp pilus assembly protein PilF